MEVWGSIPPPRLTPMGVCCRGCRPDAAGTAADGHHHAPGWCLIDPGVHGSARRCHRPAQPAGSPGRGTGLCGTGCVIRTAQVTGPFGRSPSSIPSREVHERSIAGTSQVSKRSAETRAPASCKQAYPWPVVAFCRPGRGGLLRGVSVKEIRDPSRALATAVDPVGQAWARPSTHPVAFRESCGLITRGRRAIEIPEQAVW
jgi:hypothetical protein